MVWLAHAASMNHCLTSGSGVASTGDRSPARRTVTGYRRGAAIRSSLLTYSLCLDSADADRGAVAGEAVRHGAHPPFATVEERLGHIVHAPDLVDCLWHRLGLTPLGRVVSR